MLEAEMAKLKAHGSPKSGSEPEPEDAAAGAALQVTASVRQARTELEEVRKSQYKTIYHITHS